MASFVIEGGHRLSGDIYPQGAKNEVLQIICATLLTAEEVTVHNIPDILDVNIAWKVYLEGNVLIQLPGYRMESSDALYSEERPKRTDVMLTAIPYYAWANRGENQMRVWMPEE